MATSTTVTKRTNKVLFTLYSTRIGGKTTYRVTARIPGFGPAILRKPEGQSTFPNRSAAMKACRRRAAALGYKAEFRNSSATLRTASAV